MGEGNKYPSRKMMYEWGKDAPQMLAKDAEAIDSKIMTVFVASSIIISVVIALEGQIEANAKLIPLFAAGLSFLVIVIRCLISIRAQLIYTGDDPRILREDYWVLEENEAMTEYWEHVEKDFAQNLEVVESKSNTLRLIVPLLGLEVISLIVWITINV